MNQLQVKNKSLNDQYWLIRPNIPDGIKSQVTPYLLPYDHPARELLDRIYQSSTSALGELTDPYDFGKQFKVIKHPELFKEHGLLIKEPQKNESLFENKKYSRQLRSVQGHRVGCQLIESKKYTHVRVTQSWLYPLPGAADRGATLTYYLALPIRTILNAMSITSPRWLKYGDSILRDRFIAIEECINIQPPNFTLLETLSKDVTDEWKEVFEAVGFQDAHERNFSLAKDGTISLFDLDMYSRKIVKNTLNGKLGMGMLLPDRYPKSG